MIIVVVLLLVAAPPADATWSIIATDSETGEVGVVMASCVPAGVLGNSDEVLVPIVLVPDSGAAVIQGTVNIDSPALIRGLLDLDAEPEQVLDRLLSDEFDTLTTLRQYGVVNVGGAVASFTGADVEGRVGQARDDGVVVQGALLADDAVVDQALARFQAAREDGADLAAALVAGLVAGSDAGGDRRCDPDQTALFGHVAVALPGDDPIKPSTLLTVTVDEGDGQNPVLLLADELAAGSTGWVDRGLLEPAGVSRVWPLAVAGLLAIAALYAIRKGMGSPSARRGPRRQA